MSGSRGWSMIGKPKPLGQAVAVEPLPVVAAIVRAVDAAVVLLPEPLGLRRVREQLVDALADLRVLLGHEVGSDVLVDRRPGLARRRPSGTSPRRRWRRTSGSGSSASSWIEWQHMPPAPGSQRSRVSCWVRLATDANVLPPSVERSSAPGAAPSQSSPGSRPGRTCHVFSSLSPDSSGKPDLLGALPGLAHVGRALDRPAVGVRVRRRVERAVAASTIAWRTSQPSSVGPSSFHERRSSDCSWNRPLRVPMSSVTLTPGA